jgi:hypothetical protein
VSIPANDAAYKKRLVKAIADGYPYAQRSGFAYTAWLRERKRILFAMGLEAKPPKAYKERTPAPPVAEGQLSLLEANSHVHL